MASFRFDPSLVPVDVRVDDKMIRVRFSGGLETATPVDRFSRLAKAQPSQLVRWQLNGRGYGIHWPDVDEDISVPGLFATAKPGPRSAIEQVPVLIGDLLNTTGQLNRMFKDRPFTPDGHLVGSIGEVVAEYIYGLKLQPCSTPQIDAFSEDGRSVQIKLTGANGRSFGIRWAKNMPTKPAEILLCMQLTSGGFAEIYNGKFPEQLLADKADTSTGQIQLSLRKLAALNPSLLARRNTFDSINKWFIAEMADVA